MRFWGIIFFSLAVSVVLTTAGQTESTEPRVKLRWMGHWKGEGGRERLVHEVRDEFQFIHPEIDLEFKFATDIFPQKSQMAAAEYIAEMIRSGELEWDVVWLDPLIYSRVAQELDDWNWGHKHLVDFSTVPGFEKTQKEFLSKERETHEYTAGILTGPYIEGYFYTAWYNKAVADQLGLEIREEGMTAADLLGYVKKIHAYNQTVDQPVSAFLNVDHSGSLLRLYLGLLFSAIPSEQPDEAAYARTDAFFTELKRFQPLEGHTSFTNWFEAAHYMLDENRALFFFDATWRYNTFESVCPDKLGNLRLAQIPAFDGKCRMMGGYMPTWAVLKNAPGREAGIELMRFWSRPPIAQKWVRYTKCPTGLRGDLYDPSFGKDIHAQYQRKLRAKKQSLLVDPPVFLHRAAKSAHQLDSERISAVIDGLTGEEEE